MPQRYEGQLALKLMFITLLLKHFPLFSFFSFNTQSYTSQPKQYVNYRKHSINTPIYIYLSIIYPPIRQSTYPSICWPFPAMPVVRVSVYLPWRPADVYCDGAEYSSNQYGPHQYWISHSGLAGCPPAAYSNIVSRIVIIGAELWPSSLQATEYFQRKPEKKCLCFHFPTKASDFSERGIWTTEGRGKLLRGSESIRSPRTGRGKRGMERWWKSKNPTKAKNRHESVPWSLIHGVLLFSLLSPFLSPSHIHLGVKAIDVLPLMAKRGLY